MTGLIAEPNTVTCDDSSSANKELILPESHAMFHHAAFLFFCIATMKHDLLKLFIKKIGKGWCDTGLMSSCNLMSPA